MTDNSADPATAGQPEVGTPDVPAGPADASTAEISPTEVGPAGSGLPKVYGDARGLPRALIIMLGLATAVIVAAGIYQVPGILAPIFLAVVLTIVVEPLRGSMIRKGAPRWLASLTLVLVIFAILLGLIAGLVIGVAQLATLLPQYSAEIQQDITNLQNWLAGLGISQSDVQSMTSNVSSSSIISAVEGLLSSVTSVLSALLFVLVLVIFMGLDGAMFGGQDAAGEGRARTGPRCARPVRPGHPPLLRGGDRLRRDRGGAGRHRPGASSVSRPRDCGRCWRSSPTTCPTSGSSSG